MCFTNCDYRILANVLANRLDKVLPYVISCDQTGYEKECFIGQLVFKYKVLATFNVCHH